MNKFSFFLASQDDYWDYMDLIGAESAFDAAKKYMARYKESQISAIEDAKCYYLLAKKSDCMVECDHPPDERIVLPSEIHVVPMCVPAGYHDGICSDRKYKAQAFDELWDWDKKVVIRL